MNIDFRRVHVLHRAGFYVGPRDPSRNTAFAGEWMVARSLEISDTEDAGRGGFCIVGDDLPRMIEEAISLYEL